MYAKRGAWNFKILFGGEVEDEARPFCTAARVESREKVVWRLKGHVMVALLDHDLLYLEFSSPKEAKWVLENGSRIFKGDAWHLEWWNPSINCMCKKDQAKEA